VGTITSPAGTVHGLALTGLTDCGCYAFSGFTGAVPPATPAQWQFVALASDHAGVCPAEPANGTYRDSEITFRLTLVGWADYPADAPVYPPAGDLPLTFQANQILTTSDGAHRVCRPAVMQAHRGSAGTDHAATSGTVTVTQWDSGGVTASWDLAFNGDHTTGAMSAPWCGTPPA
jgi:hypothetical protein